MSKKEVPTTTPDWRAAVKRRTRFYLLMAFLLAVLFGVLVYQFFSQQANIHQGEMTTAVFAADDIEAGTLLTLDMLDQREISSGSIPVTHFESEGQVTDKITLYPLVRGEVILPGKLMGGRGGLLAQRCPSGKWCVSIPKDWFIASPPEVSAGDRVEIASVLRGQSQENAGFIATNVQVVVSPEGGESAEYILAVDDQEALSLLFARANEFQLLILLRPAGG